jgi:hypothetical protein
MNNLISVYKKIHINFEMIIDSTTHISTWRLEEIISAYHSFKIQSQLILQQTKKRSTKEQNLKRDTQASHNLIILLAMPVEVHIEDIVLI